MSEKTNEEVAEFFNNVKDSMGNYALHICASYGSCKYIHTSSNCCLFVHSSYIILTTSYVDDVMDALFDIQYFECDPVTRLDQDTPLHTAVRFANEKDASLGLEMIEMMCEAGCDPRVRNKHGQKPADLVFGDHKEIKSALQKAEYILNENIQVNEEDENGEGSASDSE